MLLYISKSSTSVLVPSKEVPQKVIFLLSRHTCDLILKYYLKKADELLYLYRLYPSSVILN